MTLRATRWQRAGLSGLRHLAAWSAVGLLATAATAQRTTFDPQVNVGLFSTNNVAITREDARSDWGLRLGLILPVVLQLDRGSLSFTYSPRVELFREADNFNNVSHRLRLGLVTVPAPDSSLNLTAAYSDTQDQGVVESADPADLFLTQRTDRQRASLDLIYGDQLRNRWNWGFTLGGSIWNYERLVESDDGADPIPLEDRSEVRSSVQLTRSLSPTTALGLRYGYRRFVLELSGDENSHSVSFVFQKDVAERLSLEFSVGGFRNTGEAVTGPLDPASGTRSGVQGQFRLTRVWQQSSLSIVAGHVPSSGGARIGTSVNSFVGLSYGNRGSQVWTWGLDTRVARRDPSDENQRVINSIALGGRVGRRLSHKTTIRMTARVFDQTDDGGETKGTYIYTWLGVVWRPLAR
ncbi:MAG: hypothetical protein WBH85_00650 [Thermoanaerobaculia bacterium]